MQDEELIKLIKYGDRDSADKLIKRYYAPVLRYCSRLCADLGRAEDLTQETFLRVFRDIARYDGRGSFRAYIYTIAHHLCIDEARKPPVVPLDEEMAAPDRALKQIDDRDEAKRLLKSLSPEQREAALLRFGEELSFKEIGRICGVPARTAQSRARLALKIMRREEKV